MKQGRTAQVSKDVALETAKSRLTDLGYLSPTGVNGLPDAGGVCSLSQYMQQIQAAPLQELLDRIRDAIDRVPRGKLVSGTF